VKFLVTFFPDEDGGYTADCPALHGCVSHGATLEEAEANIKDAIRLYLETMKDEGLELDVHVAQIEVSAN
jgi:predicted RNase H-like HicB family nuclease